MYVRILPRYSAEKVRVYIAVIGRSRDLLCVRQDAIHHAIVIFMILCLCTCSASCLSNSSGYIINRSPSHIRTYNFSTGNSLSLPLLHHYTNNYIISKVKESQNLCSVRFYVPLESP